MNEIDIFLELLDENNLYYICRQMKINVKNRNNKELNKIRLRQKFKTGNKSFSNFIMKNIDDEISKLTENEYLIFLRYIGSNAYSNHRKFINLLGHFPKLAEEYIGKIIENLKTDKHVYDFDILFDEKEIENLFNKTFEFIDKESIIDVIDSIVQFIIKENIIDLSKVENITMEKIKKYTLNDLFGFRNGLSNEEDLLSKYYYVKTHEIEEPLYSHLLLNIYYELLLMLKPSIKKIKNLEENTSLISENNEFKKENEELKIKIKRYKHKEKQLEKSLEENSRLNKSIVDTDNQVNLYKKEIENFKIEYKNSLENQIKIEGMLNDYEDQINEINKYIEDFKLNSFNKNIVLITDCDINLLRKLYGNEIIFLSSSKIKEKKLLNLPKEIKGILIERIGINSKTIMWIKKQFKGGNILINIVNPSDDKELLEEIAMMKDKIRRKF